MNEDEPESCRDGGANNKNCSEKGVLRNVRVTKTGLDGKQTTKTYFVRVIRKPKCGVQISLEPD